MTESKKYHWLKLKKDWFDSKRIKKLRSIAGGDTYTIIYLKMQLLSMNNDGHIYFEGVEDNIAGELALELDESEDNVQVTLAFLEKQGLLEMVETDDYLLTEVPNCIGKECSSAERVRQYRERKRAESQKALQCNNEVTECNTEKEKEKEIEKEIEIEIDKEKISKTDFQQIIDLFHSICVSFPKVRALNDARRKAIKARLNTYSIEEIKEAFIKAESSDFMKGKNDRNWSATFDWIMKDSNLVKILEGNYDNKGGKEHGRTGNNNSANEDTSINAKFKEQGINVGEFEGF